MGIQINQLTASALNAGQSVPVYDPSKGDTRRWSVADLLSWTQTNLVFPTTKPNTQYSAPVATGFSVQITNTGDDVHLILTPAADYAAGTIVLPINTSLRDKQLVIINCTKVVTTLTVNGNGATAVLGTPTAFAVHGYFALKYDITLNTWYRIG